MVEPLIKKRKIAVVGIKDQLNVNKIKNDLREKIGIIEVDVDEAKGYVEVKYDLRKINFEKIEKSIDKMGIDLSRKITEKLKRGMAKFTEQNELDNLTAAPSSCCSDPKDACHKANR